MVSKGQLILKGSLRYPQIFQTQKNKPDSTMITHVELFLFVFWKNWRHQKEISKLTDLWRQIVSIGDVV